MITAGLRRAIGAAAGREDADPLLRPGPAPGSYTSALPFLLSPEDAAALAARLAAEPWIQTARITGPGFLTVTVTHATLARLAIRIAHAGPGCAASTALAGRTVHLGTRPALPTPGVPGWPEARAALAVQLTARLAAAAGATVIFDTERSGVPAPPPHPAPPAGSAKTAYAIPQAGSAKAAAIAPTGSGPVAYAVAFAGEDAVRFALARMPPGAPDAKHPPPDPAVLARHVLANPAYAVRYAHAAAAAVLRWAAALGIRPAGFTPRLLAEPGELALLGALSWLPERVAVAARRGRPDEFAGYLEELAALTVDTMSTTSFTKIYQISSERLWLADAARTGLAAGLGLLGVGAPSRL